MIWKGAWYLNLIIRFKVCLGEGFSYVIKLGHSVCYLNMELHNNKKTVSGSAVLVQMGDSAGTAAIMRFDSECRRSKAIESVASTVYDIALK